MAGGLVGWLGWLAGWLVGCDKKVIDFDRPYLMITASNGTTGTRVRKKGEEERVSLLRLAIHLLLVWLACELLLACLWLSFGLPLARLWLAFAFALPLARF